MAYAHTNPDYDYSPERAVREIVAQRKRHSIIALGTGILFLVVFGTVVYLSYRDVPAPPTPANGNPAAVIQRR